MIVKCLLGKTSWSLQKRHWLQAALQKNGDSSIVSCIFAAEVARCDAGGRQETEPVIVPM